MDEIVIPMQTFHDTNQTWRNTSVASDTGAPPFKPFRLLIATDAWAPQVNGVVRTLEMLRDEAQFLGVEIKFLTPENFRTIGMPTYPEIRLSLVGTRRIADMINDIAPDAIHIATEGPLGLLVRHFCLSRGREFTTCYHTRYPEYIAARAPVPLSRSYAALRRFHNAAAATMVATPKLRDELAARGFSKLTLWQRGIDVRPFLSAKRNEHMFDGPVFMAVGRVAVEKNLEAFLSLELPGTKVIVGDGPARDSLQKKYPSARFLSKKTVTELATLYASADVFVFPSLTDTFGLVMLEALAAGTPIAAFPVSAPQDVLGNSGCGVLSHDLRAAALEALNIDRNLCRAYGARHDMRRSTISFLSTISSRMNAPELETRIGIRPAIAAE